MSPFSFRGSVHQNFVDFTFATGKIIGYIFTLQGEIDSNVAMSLSNKASLAFLQKHLGKKGIFFPDINQMILRKKLFILTVHESHFDCSQLVYGGTLQSVHLKTI